MSTQAITTTNIPTSPTDAAISAINARLAQNTPTPDFGAVEPRLSSLSFAELDDLIDCELKRNKDVLVPYLREMRSRFEGVQGERNDLHPDTPTMGWQAWVRSKKEKNGVSLSTANRLLAADREPKPKKKKVEPEATSPPLTPVQNDVVQALVGQGFKRDEAVEKTMAAGEGDFDALFRAVLTGTKATAAPAVDPRITELELENQALRTENLKLQEENAGLKQRLEAISKAFASPPAL
jgi:hypothetical protein